MQRLPRESPQRNTPWQFYLSTHSVSSVWQGVLFIWFLFLSQDDVIFWKGTTNPYNTRYLPEAKKAFEALGGIVFKGHHKVFFTTNYGDDVDKVTQMLRWVTTPGQMWWRFLVESSTLPGLLTRFIHSNQYPIPNILLNRSAHLAITLTSNTSQCCGR